MPPTKGCQVLPPCSDIKCFNLIKSLSITINIVINANSQSNHQHQQNRLLLNRTSSTIIATALKSVSSEFWTKQTDYLEFSDKKGRFEHVCTRVVEVGRLSTNANNAFNSLVGRIFASSRQKRFSKIA